jgi:cytochrome b
MSGSTAGMATIRIWDLPTRLFHWLIFLLIAASWLTQQIGRLDLHIKLGLVTVGLVLFRLFWGLIGSSTAHFAGFVKGPLAVARYLKGQSGPASGHNPLGGWSVMVMLLLLATQAGLGLFVIDEDGLNGGPFSRLISYDSARTLAHRHEAVFYILLGMIGVHVAAILFYALVRRDNLVPPMVTGRRAAAAGDAAMQPAPLWRFFVAAGLAAAITLWIAGIL